MIRHILLVAAREFRQIAMTRSFWITLLILPIALAVGPLTQRFMSKDEPDRVMLIDRTGGSTAQAIQQRFELDHQRDVLSDLSRYVQRYHLDAAAPNALWSQHDRWFADSDVARFVAEGGLPAAEAKLKPATPAGTPAYTPPKADYTFLPVPPDVAGASDAAIDGKLQALLHPTGKDTKPLDYAVLIPAGFGASPVVRLWANGDPAPGFIGVLQPVLTQELRSRYLQSNGLSPEAARAAGSIAPALSISSPPPGGGARERVLIRSILPLVAAYMLMMSLMLSGSWMLQGTVEERSNKLLETVLACVSPEELMYGKLVGTVGIGLSMIAVWMLCGIGAGYATQGSIADMIRPALEPLNSFGVIATMIYFFVAGYVAIAMFFLAIGAMSDSMRDAQGYLTPVLMAILIPITILIQAVLRGGGGIGIEVLTWIPIYTPFAVLARLGTGIAQWEVVGTGLLLAVFIAIELVLLGRLFRASLLATGQKASLAMVVRRMRRQSAS
ncbi:ABC transporter permease [Sphingomonas sp.]|jgi:ABC-type Na+ efflux pump permease subunit|uniref:ABC transporter permease n=1 Tax=Sphingomonas sp. TaxID=28214 RepID=UPI002E3131D2|nr:ABC transporter permease [Sphingomonas sp.]HEX4693222.1 ABC transporter permease [Sphingomonas sp.]